jgi:hypothetical protein
MSEQSGSGEQDMTAEEEQQLLSVLRTALGTVPDLKDPAKEMAPPSVIEGAMWVHDWHNMDAELAQITFDSNDTRELTGVRSASSLRQLKFGIDDFEIGIHIEPGEAGVSLTGTVWPVVDGNIEIVVGGVVHRSVIDRLGAFLIDNVDHGTALAFVETSNQTIRLGSFEL